MIPLAKAFQEAGHDVWVVTMPQLEHHVLEAGLPAHAMGARADLSVALADMWQRMSRSGDTSVRWGRWSTWIRWSTLTAELLLPELIKVARSFPPDLVIYEPTDIAGPAVADLAGVPAVMHNWGLPILGCEGGPLHTAAIGLRRRFMLPDRISGPHLVLDVCPPTYQGTGYVAYPGYLPHEDRHQMQYVPYNGGGGMPDWLSAPPRAPRVCLTSGLTVAGYSLALVKHTVAALKDVDVEVIIACRTEDAANLDIGLPPSIKVVPWLPLNLVLPTCSASIHHGGAGCTMTSLVHGVPQLVVPAMNDQFANAARVAETGVGHALQRDDFTATAVREIVEDLIEGDSCRSAAGEIAAEIAAQPPLAEAVKVLEELAAA